MSYGDFPSLTRQGAQQTASVFAGTISATASFPVFTAQQPCLLLSASVVAWGSTLATSDTNFYTVDLGRNRANNRVAVATKTTKVTGGEAMTQRTDWNFDAIAFSAANALLAKGDHAEFVFTLTGTATLTGPVGLTVRYLIL